MAWTWLTALLRDERPDWPATPACAPAQLLEVATREGIVALVHERLDAQHYPDEVLAPFAAATRGEAAMLLMREGECRRVLAAMAAEGLPALLLKGSALAYWAYAEPHLRKCVDIDLLLRSRAEVDRATSALAALGYQLRERTVPGDLISYELTCIRRASVGARVDLDLHWRLVNAPLYAERLQPDELWRDAIALPRLGPSAFGLSPVHALLHACMHRALNLQFGDGDRLKWLYDLHVLAGRLDHLQWQALTQLAIERGLAGTCLHGLKAAQAEFATVLPEPPASELANAAAGETLDMHRVHRWLYMQRANCMALPSSRLRLRWLRQRLLPDAGYLRDRYGKQYGSLPAIVLGRLRDGLRRMGI